MDKNELLMIILAFILGCMCSGMMKQMCGQRLVEGSFLYNIFSIYKKPPADRGDSCNHSNDCKGALVCNMSNICD